MRPKKILLIIESSETGGAESMFAELACRLDRRRFDPHVGVMCEGWLTSQLISMQLEPLRIPSSQGGFDVKALSGIRRLVKGLGIDIVHSHLFTSNVYASAACVLTGVPVVSTFHGTTDVEERDRAKRLKWGVINRFSRCSVFVSNYLRDHFVRQGLAEPSLARVIHNGIDVDRFRRSPSSAEARGALGLPPDAFVVGCVGDLRSAKDYLTAIRAFRLIHGQLPRARMIVVGAKTDLLVELMALRDGLGLADAIDFIGFHPDTSKVLPAFDVYLLSSVTEGFSLTLVEAMAAGLPVVSTRSGGPEEIVRHGETGLLVDVANAIGIADAILLLARDRAGAATLALAGARLAADRFSVDSMVRSYESLFDELASR